jgi:uncharacterized protein (TIGR03083 family)
MTIASVAAAYGQSLRALLALGEQLGPADWDRPTLCPLWSVKDIYAHIAGPEVWAAQGAPAYAEPTQDFIDAHVVERRDHTPAALLAELRDVLVVRQKQLDEAEKQPTVFIPRLHADGPHEWGLRFRVFDLWTHEQDVRVAVNRPGNLGTDSARITQEILIQSLPRSVAKVAGAPPGSSVRLTATGDLPMDVTVAVGPDGRGALTQAGDADAHLAMTWESFARLGTGRGDVADYPVTIAGDEALGRRVLASLNVAP